MPKTYSESFREEMVQTYLSTKGEWKKQSDFAKAHSLNPCTFSYWVRDFVKIANAKLLPNSVLLNDILGIIAPFTDVKIVTTSDIGNVIYQGRCRSVNDSILEKHGMSEVALMSPAKNCVVLVIESL